MTVALLDAMTMRDGGTTFVVVEKREVGQVTYTFDYSLPWDGRARYITEHIADGSSKILPINGPQEIAACELIRALLVGEFGESLVESFAKGEANNPGSEKWFYAFNFLRHAVKEQKIHV